MRTSRDNRKNSLQTSKVPITHPSTISRLRPSDGHPSPYYLIVIFFVPRFFLHVLFPSSRRHYFNFIVLTPTFFSNVIRVFPNHTVANQTRMYKAYNVYNTRIIILRRGGGGWRFYVRLPAEHKATRRYAYIILYHCCMYPFMTIEINILTTHCAPYVHCPPV